MTLTLVAERLAVELLLPIFTTYFYSVTTGDRIPISSKGASAQHIRKKEEICKLPIMNPLPLLRDYLPLNEHMFPTILVE